ncbi:MAG: serine/threonine protein kinase [Planctomycetota bacterium]|nr:MAG: serine/threonine protein kinase [Planctomycetota bacterium]
MATTTLVHEASATRTWGGHVAAGCSPALLEQYQAIIQRQRVSWTEHLRFIRPLGSGGQGVVYLTERRGADDFTLPVAVKVFSPERYANDAAYDEAMYRIAAVSARVAQIQQDHLLAVHNWVERHRIRLMEMEWVDGYDLRELLTRRRYEQVQQRVSPERWREINEVVVTAGPVQPRLKPGVAMAVIRDCLAALAALHRGGIVHGDLKPSNIMLKRTGSGKIVDFGSAYVLDDPPPQRTCTPTYAAPEVLENGECTPRSDLASLGYVLIEMLAGVSPFYGLTTRKELLEQKRFLAQRLDKVLPKDVVSSELLMNFCRRLIAPDPDRRFPDAEQADLQPEGAAAFHRQLVKGDLASEYDNDIRLWLQELGH